MTPANDIDDHAVTGSPDDGFNDGGDNSDDEYVDWCKVDWCGLLIWRVEVLL